MEVNDPRGLHWAAVMEDTILAQKLINQGADVNALDSHGRATPLGVAADSGNMDIVRLLISHGADVNKACPLYYAAQKGHLKIVRVLLESGADPQKYRVKNIPSSFLAAARGGYLKVLKLLVGEKKLSEEESGVMLLAAAINGHDKVVGYLLTKDAPVDTTDSDDRTALYMASEYGHLSVVEILLKNGADISRETKYGTTPLEIARKKGHTAVVEVLQNIRR